MNFNYICGMNFNIGDKVMISPDSVYYGSLSRTNPADTVGVVISFIDDYVYDGYSLRVRWGKDCTNSYRVCDLVHVGFGTLRNFSFN